jgi:AbiV family abortive infection protein
MNQAKPLNAAIARLSLGKLNRQAVLPIDQVAEGLTACYRNASSLLEDARLLYFVPRPHRALSLTILALEELAKIPELHDQFANPETRSNPESWKEFWSRFVTHKPKQRRITAYGEKIAASGWTPFSATIGPEIAAVLDSVKQRGFYVDYVAPHFLVPAANSDVALAFEQLFLFAAERLGAFASWHVSPQRSLDFLNACVQAASTDLGARASALKKAGTFYEWASTHTETELVADGTRALYYFSAEAVPDYSEFLRIFGDIQSRWSANDRVGLLNSLVAPLRGALEKPLGKETYSRDLKMFKLAFSFGSAELTDEEVATIFGLPAGPSVKAHFTSG